MTTLSPKGSKYNRKHDEKEEHDGDFPAIAQKERPSMKGAHDQDDMKDMHGSKGSKGLKGLKGLKDAKHTNVSHPQVKAKHHHQHHDHDHDHDHEHEYEHDNDTNHRTTKHSLDQNQNQNEKTLSHGKENVRTYDNEHTEVVKLNRNNTSGLDPAAQQYVSTVKKLRQGQSEALPYPYGDQALDLSPVEMKGGDLSMNTTATATPPTTTFSQQPMQMPQMQPHMQQMPQMSQMPQMPQMPQYFGPYQNQNTSYSTQNYPHINPTNMNANMMNANMMNANMMNTNMNMNHMNTMSPTMNTNINGNTHTTTSTTTGMTSQGNESGLNVLKLVETSPGYVRKMEKEARFSPTLLQQVGGQYVEGDLPQGKSRHTTRTVTTTGGERVIVTKTVTRVPFQEISVRTRQVVREVESKPMVLGVQPKPVVPSVDIQAKLRARAQGKPLEMVQVLLKDPPSIDLPKLEPMHLERSLHLEHAAPSFDICLKPVDTCMAVSYALQEDANLASRKTSKPVNIEQKVVRKTTKEVRTIPTVVQQTTDAHEACNVSYEKTHEPAKAWKSEVTRTTKSDALSSDSADFENEAERFIHGQDVDHEMVVSSSSSSSLSPSLDPSEEKQGKYSNRKMVTSSSSSSSSSSDPNEATKLRYKGMGIIDQMKKQADDLRIAAQETNEGIDALDSARQKEVQIRLNSHRAQLEKDLEAKVAEQQDLMFRVQSNAKKLRTTVTDQIKSETARIEAQIMAQVAQDKKELLGVMKSYEKQEKANVDSIDPWFKARKEELEAKIEKSHEKLQLAKAELSEKLSARLLAIDAEACDRLEKIQVKMKSEIEALEKMKSEAEEYELEMFQKLRQQDESRMTQELLQQNQLEMRFLTDARETVQTDVDAKKSEVQTLAELRKKDLRRQVEMECALVDQYLSENLDELEKERARAQEMIDRREEELRLRLGLEQDRVVVAWDPAMNGLNTQLQALRQQTEQKQKELQDILEREAQRIEKLQAKRREEILALQKALENNFDGRCRELQEMKAERLKAYEDLHKTAKDTCQNRMKEIEDVCARKIEEIDQRLKAYLKALEQESLVHQHELQRILKASADRAKKLSMDITVIKERILENKQGIVEELKAAKEEVEQKEMLLEKLRNIEEDRKKAVLQTEDAYERLKQEVNDTRVALGGVRLSNEEIAATSHDYQVESVGRKSEHRTEAEAKSRGSRSTEVESNIGLGTIRRKIRDGITSFTRV